MRRFLQFMLKLIKSMLCAAHVDIQREEPGVSQHEDPFFVEYRNKALPAKEI